MIFTFYKARGLSVGGCSAYYWKRVSGGCIGVLQNTHMLVNASYCSALPQALLQPQIELYLPAPSLATNTTA
jgi:hypothetical protein